MLLDKLSRQAGLTARVKHQHASLCNEVERSSGTGQQLCEGLRRVVVQPFIKRENLGDE